MFGVRANGSFANLKVKHYKETDIEFSSFRYLYSISTSTFQLSVSLFFYNSILADLNMIIYNIRLLSELYRTQNAAQKDVCSVSSKANSSNCDDIRK